MDFAAYFFWGGLVSAFGIAVILRNLETDRMTARIVECAGVVRRRVHVIVFGNSEVAVWKNGGSAQSPVRYDVTIRRDPHDCQDCGDCSRCVNEAIHWIERQLAY